MTKDYICSQLFKEANKLGCDVNVTISEREVDGKHSYTYFSVLIDGFCYVTAERTLEDAILALKINFKQETEEKIAKLEQQLATLKRRQNVC